MKSYNSLLGKVSRKINIRKTIALLEAKSLICFSNILERYTLSGQKSNWTKMNFEAIYSQKEGKRHIINFFQYFMGNPWFFKLWLTWVDIDWYEFWWNSEGTLVQISTTAFSQISSSNTIRRRPYWMQANLNKAPWNWLSSDADSNPQSLLLFCYKQSQILLELTKLILD